jgi:hypothetical protein
MDDIAKGFTLGHLKLFQSIKFNDIKEYLCGKKPLPTSILGMGERFDNIVEWFALQILREQEEIKRQNLIEKIFILGHSLLQKHNYHGAMQIASLFTKKPIERILSDRQSNTKEWQPIYMGNKHWQAISVLTKLGNNHKTYRDLLAMHPDSPCLPIFPIILKDLACAREYYQEVSRERMMKGLEWTVSTLETLSRSQSFLAESNENTDCVLKFFWNLPKTSEETLDELSDSIKEWPTLKRKAPQGPLREWDASHLTYVFMENNCKSQVKAFFDRRIYDGAGVVEYMGNIKSEEQNNKLRELGISDIMIDIIISSHEQEVREDR